MDSAGRSGGRRGDGRGSFNNIMDSAGTSRGGGSSGGRGGGRGSFNRGRGWNIRNSGVIRSINSTENGDEAEDCESPELSRHVGLETICVSTHHDGESSQVQTPSGSNVMEQTPPSSHRENIWLEGNEFNTSQVGKKIVKNFKSMYHGPWATWADVDSDSRNRMFERFSNMYAWNHDIHDLIYEAWEAHLQLRMPDIMSRARHKALEMATEAGLVFDDNDLSALLPYNRSWMKHEYWVILINEKWKNDRWKKVSKVNKKNRNSQKCGKVAKHTGGSRSLTHTRLYLEIKRGRKVSGTELFAHYYTKKKLISEEDEMPASTTPEFVDPRAKYFMDKYTSAFYEKHGEDTNINEITNMELWEQCGESRKGRLPRSGRRQDPFFLLTGTPRSHSSAGSSYSAANVEEIRTLKERIATLQENESALREKLQENENSLRLELEAQRLSTEKQTKEMQDQIATLTRMMLQQFQQKDPPPTT